MMNEPRPVMRVKADARARAFLERLRDDAEYRERLQTNPGEALAEYGVPREDAPDEVELPKPEEVDALLAGASEPDAFGVFDLPPDAGDMLSVFLKPLAGAMALVPAGGSDSPR